MIQDDTSVNRLGGIRTTDLSSEGSARPSASSCSQWASSVNGSPRRTTRRPESDGEVAHSTSIFCHGIPLFFGSLRLNMSACCAARWRWLSAHCFPLMTLKPTMDGSRTPNSPLSGRGGAGPARLLLAANNGREEIVSNISIAACSSLAEMWNCAVRPALRALPTGGGVTGVRVNMCW